MLNELLSTIKDLAEDIELLEDGEAYDLLVSGLLNAIEGAARANENLSIYREVVEEVSSRIEEDE